MQASLFNSGVKMISLAIPCSLPSSTATSQSIAPWYQICHSGTAAFENYFFRSFLESVLREITEVSSPIWVYANLNIIIVIVILISLSTSASSNIITYALAYLGTFHLGLTSNIELSQGCGRWQGVVAKRMAVVADGQQWWLGAVDSNQTKLAYGVKRSRSKLGKFTLFQK
ncbi:hypothetical protein M5K25_009164 [Dendrobium thyrsiflorum]|uniref:Uncharacterized protein n=1 Tax=Dendrobium thyrsiflorum TaxID=117978 RepID=A0ABD0V4T9_DENTH